jgi:hypothetical protein
MKKLYYYCFSFPLFCPTTNSVEFHKSKSFEETITITISGSTVDEAAWELRIILYIYGLGLMIPMMQTVAIVQVMAHGQVLMK